MSVIALAREDKWRQWTHSSAAQPNPITAAFPSTARRGLMKRFKLSARRRAVARERLRGSCSTHTPGGFTALPFPIPFRMHHSSSFRTGALATFAAMLACHAHAADHHLRSIPSNMVWGYFAADTPAVMTIKSGDTVVIDTVSLGGLTDDNPEKFFTDHGFSLDNPVVKESIAIKKEVKSLGIKGHMMTGPIFIEGAEPGDTLEVRVLDIKSRLPYGMNSGGPGRGGIPDVVPRPYQKYIPFDLSRNVAKFSDTIEVPLNPFQGVMAVAPTPDRGKLPSGPPYPDVGGNFDNKHLGKGATVYLPVQIPGALFHVGDPHAAQGNGEVSISAIESANTVTMQFIIRKDMKIKTPWAETPTHYIVMGLDVELNNAMHKAILNSLDFLKEKKQLDFFDSLALCSVAVDFEVTQVVDGTKGIHAMIPKALFKDGKSTAYWYNPDAVLTAAK
jgi:acetamidase/formamidase